MTAQLRDRINFTTLDLILFVTLTFCDLKKQGRKVEFSVLDLITFHNASEPIHCTTAASYFPKPAVVKFKII